MKFKSKPQIIEAEQYVNDFVKGMCSNKKCFLSDIPHIHTIHRNQAVKLEKGDWVVPEPDGKHFYPVKDEIFRNRYEMLDD